MKMTKVQYYFKLVLNGDILAAVVVLPGIVNACKAQKNIKKYCPKVADKGLHVFK
jgi:hypothetical protein